MTLSFWLGGIVMKGLTNIAQFNIWGYCTKQKDNIDISILMDQRRLNIAQHDICLPKLHKNSRKSQDIKWLENNQLWLRLCLTRIALMFGLDLLIYGLDFLIYGLDFESLIFLFG